MKWQPSASLDNLKQRAAIISSIRQFFASRDVLEVETPTLSHASVTDLHLSAFETCFDSPMEAQSRTLYLQTSPEYAMKRLLCAGSGAIFQISKAFRNEESGRYHNPEFTMLEWYRPGFDHHQLMDEVDQLIQTILECQPAERISYQQCFVTHLGFDPLIATLEALKQQASAHGFENIAAAEDDPDTLLQLLFSHCVEPRIGQDKPCLVYGFPASQAALARLEPEDMRVARRFELYYRGIELANGFHELANAGEQRQRFEADNQKRQAAGKPARAIDEYFLAALEQGLPDCAGVALGIDRLVMLALGADKIAQVLSFSVDNA